MQNSHFQKSIFYVLIFLFFFKNIFFIELSRGEVLLSFVTDFSTKTDFEHVFESYEHLQSTADIMLALTNF